MRLEVLLCFSLPCSLVIVKRMLNTSRYRMASAGDVPWTVDPKSSTTAPISILSQPIGKTAEKGTCGRSEH